MKQSTLTRRRREVALIVALTVIFGFGAALFFALAAGWYFTVAFLVLGVLVLLGLFHYVTWGRVQDEQTRAPRPSDDRIPGRPSSPRPEDGRRLQGDM